MLRASTPPSSRMRIATFTMCCRRSMFVPSIFAILNDTSVNSE